MADQIEEMMLMGKKKKEENKERKKGERKKKRKKRKGKGKERGRGQNFLANYSCKQLIQIRKRKKTLLCRKLNEIIRKVYLSPKFW